MERVRKCEVEGCLAEGGLKDRTWDEPNDDITMIACDGGRPAAPAIGISPMTLCAMT
jgi:hypothetical protein